VLGEAFVNVVDLTTARRKALDGWFNLSNGGAVKLTVEYDVLDPVPQPGEMVRRTHEACYIHFRKHTCRKHTYRGERILRGEVLDDTQYGNRVGPQAL
jgi:hypothetical protein